jgi:hypothetical protein
MKKTSRVFGSLIVIGVGFAIYSLSKQISDVAKVCALFAEGAAVGDLGGIEDRFSVQLMGPFEVSGKPGTQQVVFCAALTMCDTSCSVEFKNDKVTKSGVSNL